MLNILRYRETLCVSAVLAVCSCLSVCLSDKFVSCIEMAKDIVKVFLPLSSPIILLFKKETAVI